uniref:NADH dehydrogenase subunit 2 n=1 Tax=Loxocera planivena TaxID=2963722 RepID=UPI0021148D5C|nr:NADH dehydrogenase subunit 2 [Loxocera planivena]UTM10350.1 NADH dehydrogenase subunit 2 [Loxocera planivena]
MFMNSYKIMFLLILMISSLITISANTWISAWIGLEINLLSFIPLMKDSKLNLMSSEASLKYFLIQAMASAILLFSVILFLLNYNLMMMENEIFKTMILSSLFLKSGTAPFHFWFPSIMEGLSWMSGLILMTWQKLAPMLLMTYIMIKEIMMICIIMSTIIGSLGGFNQTSLKKLMAFSSINHISWMLTALYFSENLWMIYFLIYSFMNFSLIFIFNLFNLFYMNQLFSLFMNNKMLKFFLFMNLLSLGGLPPFLGFLPKWMIIQSLILSNQILLMMMLTLITLITLFFYIRLTYSAFMLNYQENKWKTVMKCNFMYTYFSFFISFMSMMGMMLIWFLYIML